MRRGLRHDDNDWVGHSLLLCPKESKPDAEGRIIVGRQRYAATCITG